MPTKNKETKLKVPARASMEQVAVRKRLLVYGFLKDLDGSKLMAVM